MTAVTENTSATSPIASPDMQRVLGALQLDQLGERVPSNSPLHGRLTDFLVDEARLLDHNDITSWHGLLTSDLVYRMPVRRTVMRKDGLGFDPVMAHFDDDYDSITKRIERLYGESAWAEDPPSRVRRFVSNISVWETANPNEWAVVNYVLLLRSRYDMSQFDHIPAERHDLIRSTDDGLRLARRIMYVDQSLLGTPNLAVFV